MFPDDINSVTITVNELANELANDQINVNDHLWNDLNNADPLTIGMIVIITLIFFFIVIGDR